MPREVASSPETQEEMGLLLDLFRSISQGDWIHDPVSIVFKSASEKLKSLTKNQVYYRIKMLIRGGYLEEHPANASGRRMRVKMSQKGKETQKFYIDALGESGYANSTSEIIQSHEQGEEDMNSKKQESDAEVSLCQRFEHFIELLSTIVDLAPQLKKDIDTELNIYFAWRREKGATNKVSDDLRALQNTDWSTIPEMVAEWLSNLETRKPTLESLVDLIERLREIARKAQS